MDLAEKTKRFAKIEIYVTERNRRKSKRARKLKFCIDNFEEFSSCTSLHGIQYLGAKERSVFERIWWLIMILISMGICAYFIKTLWDKWRDTPVIISFAESSTPIWQIPFPALTLCAQTKIMQTKLNTTELHHDYNKNHNWADFTEEEMFIFRAAAHYCKDIRDNMTSNKTDYTDEDTINYLMNISYSNYTECEITWNRQKELCEELSNMVMTDAGLCDTFNGLDSTEIFREIAVQYNEFDDDFKNKKRMLSKGWTLENGYPNIISTVETFPRRSSSPNVGAGLRIEILLKNRDLDYVCAGIEQGYEVLLHSPSDYPRMSREFFIAPLTQQMIVSIKPNMITTSPELFNYDPERRKCFLSNERYLKYFKIYTMKNCEIECLSNYTYQTCDCVAYWMPREKKMRICGTGKIECMNNAKYELESLDMKYEHAKSINDFENMEKFGSVKNRCNCKPSCTSISYDAEITQSDRNMKDFLKATGKSEHQYDDVSLMTLRAFFKESQFIPSKRSELYGVSDFLANCGGIMGLFLGFSILSLVEIIYFLIIRPIHSIKKEASIKGN